jgi:hypothetical protein
VRCLGEESDWIGGCGLVLTVPRSRRHMAVLSLGHLNAGRSSLAFPAMFLFLVLVLVLILELKIDSVKNKCSSLFWPDLPSNSLASEAPYWRR